MRWRGDGSGREIYQAGHIPGAIYLAWHQDLNWTDERGVRDLLIPSDQPVSLSKMNQPSAISFRFSTVLDE